MIENIDQNTMSKIVKHKNITKRSKSSKKPIFIKQQQSDDYESQSNNYIEFPMIKQEPIVIQILDQMEQQKQVPIIIEKPQQKDQIQDENKFRVKQINGYFQQNDTIYFQVMIGTAKTTFRQPQLLSFDQLSRGIHNKMLIYDYMIKLCLVHQQQNKQY